MMLSVYYIWSCLYIIWSYIYIINCPVCILYMILSVCYIWCCLYIIYDLVCILYMILLVYYIWSYLYIINCPVCIYDFVCMLYLILSVYYIWSCLYIIHCPVCILHMILSVCYTLHIKYISIYQSGLQHYSHCVIKQQQCLPQDKLRHYKSNIKHSLFKSLSFYETLNTIWQQFNILSKLHKISCTICVFVLVQFLIWVLWVPKITNCHQDLGPYSQRLLS